MSEQFGSGVRLRDSDAGFGCGVPGRQVAARVEPPWRPQGVIVRQA
ncbi:MAG: hypothetical protein HYX54_09915 [Chloroflexi bacterium]|nr:hypothetical protein [Chloroflexota bacterium]